MEGNLPNSVIIASATKAITEMDVDLVVRSYPGASFVVAGSSSIPVSMAPSSTIIGSSSILIIVKSFPIHFFFSF
ncbi:hypothetical protein SLA2020_198400 [Shorea laevis]